MNKVYFVAPLIGLLVFGGFYVSHRSGLKEREAIKAAVSEASLKAKNEAELASRKIAMAEAIAAAETRKKEKEARELREKTEREARQQAVDARDKAYREQERLAKQVERLKRDLELEQAALAKFDAAKKQADSEKLFLAEFVTKSRANVRALEGLVAKLNTPAPVASPAIAN